MKALRGHPTLRGLVVRGGKHGELSEDTVLYPWASVGAQPDSWSIWNVYRDDGTLLREAGNKGRIRTPDTYEKLIGVARQAVDRSLPAQRQNRFVDPAGDPVSPEELAFPRETRVVRSCEIHSRTNVALVRVRPRRVKRVLCRLFSWPSCRGGGR